jgi:hypothetical protein
MSEYGEDVRGRSAIGSDSVEVSVEVSIVCDTGAERELRVGRKVVQVGVGERGERRARS